jgi:hypothetical protein
MQTVLNEFGGSGWELVAVSMGNMTEPRLIFKKCEKGVAGTIPLLAERAR